MRIKKLQQDIEKKLIGRRILIQTSALIQSFVGNGKVRIQIRSKGLSDSTGNPLVGYLDLAEENWEVMDTHSRSRSAPVCHFRNSQF